MNQVLPGSIQYLEEKLTGRLDAIARGCEEGFVTVGKTFEAVARAQAEVYAADVERLTVKLAAANAQLAGAAAQVAELERRLMQAERERDGARETAALQARSIGQQAAELQQLRIELTAEKHRADLAVDTEKLCTKKLLELADKLRQRDDEIARLREDSQGLDDA